MSNQEEDADKQIASRLHKLFPSPTIARKVIDVVTSKKPNGWSRRSYAPYYKECYAMEIKPFIDKQIENGENIIYRFSTFCTDETGLSKSSLYFRVNQSIRYLIECMDTDDHKYGRWYQGVNVKRVPDTGIVISRTTGQISMTPELVLPKSEQPTWRTKLDEWLESDDVEPFVQERLALTPDEVHELKVQLSQVHTIAASITQSSVKIIRMGQ